MIKQVYARYTRYVHMFSLRSVLAEHDPEVLEAVRIAFASEGLLDDGSLSLLNFEDSVLDGVGYLANVSIHLEGTRRQLTMKCLT